MKKILVGLMLSFSLLIVGCNPPQPELKGGYQSDKHYSGHMVQLSFQPEDDTFVYYIDNREVDKGTYALKEPGVYELNGDNQAIDIHLSTDNSFALYINQLNGNDPIIMNNLGDVPVYFGTEFDDVEEYEALLNEE